MIDALFDLIHTRSRNHCLSLVKREAEEEIKLRGRVRNGEMEKPYVVTPWALFIIWSDPFVTLWAHHRVAVIKEGCGPITSAPTWTIQFKSGRRIEATTCQRPNRQVLTRIQTNISSNLFQFIFTDLEIHFWNISRFLMDPPILKVDNLMIIKE